MGLEIERKFLVDPEKWEQFNKPEGKAYRQGYLVNEKEKTVRIRIAGDQAFITVKGATEGFTRKEYEYEIPLRDGKELLENFKLTGTSKTRYRIPLGGKVWEVDVFGGENEGLIVAEIELKSESDLFENPGFLLEEVTYDPRYYNSNLATNPYSNWKGGTK
ncbi:CYTH domain-containing protein [Mucilaginibacter arboris]|uniref:CYTH domain-containing protein n=1 Tax=Mucilaginibacter arboris TaxID=2682090 RepID=A0A7K1SWS1_9SPHI|nr:CYTH domain-containing protein [Mucilaginibacter arboris]MVN21744.1 CYTH domain-containing protein [Mucilaginibacter arboris]